MEAAVGLNPLWGCSNVLPEIAPPMAAHFPPLASSAAKSRRPRQAASSGVAALAVSGVSQISSAPGFHSGAGGGGGGAKLTTDDLWAEGLADCEADSCGTVPGGSLVLIPIKKAPSRLEERIATVEEGVQLSESKATFVGAVDSRGVNMLVNSPVVSARHARIEGVMEETPSWIRLLLGEGAPSIQYYLTDLNSTNGTYVNRGRLRPLVPVRIKAGDVLAFGNLGNAYRVVKVLGRKGFGW